MENETHHGRLGRLIDAIRVVSASAAGRLLRTLAYVLSGGLLALVVVFVLYLQGRPDLEVWHRARLEEEFDADSRVLAFADYQALEERLFAELEREVFDRIDAEDRTRINRFNRGSLSDPAKWDRDWNRSFEMPSASANVGVVLLHGMSDSPYSLRAMGERLSERGVWVVGIRLPGHGTAPAGLTDVRWEDLAAATRIAVRHVRARVSGPVFIVGYSTGGALGAHYAIRALHDDALVEVDGVVLVSPAIGVSSVAAFAVWQGRLGRLLRLDKLAWNDIYPEYDPFKYGSFAVNAGDVVYRLAGELQNEISRCTDEELKRLPPMLGFQSAVDATVVSGAVVDGLFARLPDNENELVLFDINRFTEVESMLTNDPGPYLDSFFAGDPLPFTLGVVTNRDEESEDVILRVRQAGAIDEQRIELGLTWPRGIYSVSHVALPTPFDDPLYGGDAGVESPGVRLGMLALRGERGVLRVPPAAMLRIQWNPFYPWMEGRILEFMGLAPAPGVPEEAE